MDKIIEYNFKNPVIFSDALNVIRDIYLNTSLMRPKQINALHESIGSHKHNIKIVWVPGRCHIPHHDIADRLAREASVLATTKEVECELREIQLAAKIYIDEKWESNWKLDKRRSQYKTYFGLNVNGNAQNIKPRNKERLITRLRLQCSRLRTHMYKLRLDVSDLCPMCNRPEIVSHFLLDCIITSKLRTNLTNICPKI